MGEQKQRTRQNDVEEIEETEVPEPKEFDIDSLLDEIDDVLEENAEEFVKAYIQKGGQ